MVTLVRREFVVEARLQEAWNHLAQVERWPSWARHIRRVVVVPGGPLTGKSAGRIQLNNGLRSTFKMVEFNPGKNWKWDGPFLWLTVHYDHQFDTVGVDRTKLTWVVASEGFGESLVGKLFARIYSRNLDMAIPRLINELRSTPE